ncbi:MAG: hypothetical protein KAU62_03455 [Candidatus Heimdallarchaeota archaeon]|nr:hypothetical protein [Candidatus Heimdallarchaeota archaeon]MCK4610195.1 hypothetical protein [Candidatus Heimdallarchaeota archaeon]
MKSDLPRTLDKLEQELERGNFHSGTYIEFKEYLLEIHESKDTSQEDRIRTKLLLSILEPNITRFEPSYYKESLIIVRIKIYIN